MSTNLRLYTKVQEQIRQWQPKERVTRQRNMALVIVGLFLSKAVHLSLIVRKWPSWSKELSLVNRLSRFLDNPHVKVREWYEPIASDLLAYCAKERIRLIIDTTKVGFGYRLMTIGLAYRSRTLPLVWSVHRGAKGHTAVSDQIALFEAIRHLVPAEAKVWVMGDTEFESPLLLEWIQAQGWHFVIRQRGSIKVRQPGQPWLNINQFELLPGQTRVIGWVHLTEKYATTPIWLILHWEKGEDDPWYLVSDCLGERRLLKLYRTRMWIEEMYGDLKGHGFDLEATQLDDPDRISRLFLAVCLTFVWLIATGSRVVKCGWRHWVDAKSRRNKSYFRIGWDWIERRLRLDESFPVSFLPYS